MKPNPKISAAVAAILSASTTTLVFAAAPADTTADTTASTEGVQEVVVTAQRRSENLQDVPITVQAITGDQLQKLNVVSFNDLLKYTPNVSYSGNGPGTGNIFMRGLGGVGSGNQSQSTTAPFPNVALYLDDQSMQFPARNNDVYLVDMERVEVLEGPQGTLFGGGAQAGAIRYITNKPKLDSVSGDVNAGYGITAGGDPNTMLNATLNVPLSPNFALRGAVFSERRGGYIDNINSTIGYVAGTAPHDIGGNPTANNGQVVGSNTNPVDYQGARLSALWRMNDDWDLLLQQNYQNMEADGYFYAYPTGTDGTALSKYQLTAFTPAYSKDRYSSTSWTLNGKLGDFLNMVYTGSYMVRHIDGQQDYSNYMRSFVGSYYACIGTGAGYFNPGNFPNQLTGHKLQCYSPVGDWHDTVRNTHHSEELRFSTNADYRLRGLFGAYWEKFVIYDDMNFNYLGIPQCSAANLAIALGGGPDCLSAVGPTPNTFANDPSLRLNSNTAFGEDLQRGYKQTAFFASADFDLIPKVLTVTGGTRYYKYDEFEFGSEYFSESTSGSFSPSGQGLVVNHLNGVCTAGGLCGFPINLQKNESGFRSRGNLTWHITPDMMAYYTFSQGFRPGGFNRTNSVLGKPPSLSGVAKYCGNINGAQTAPDPRCLPGGSLAGLNTSQFNKPAGFNSDNLINNEIGFKSEFFDHRLVFNVSGYIMKWEDVQISLFDPVHLGNTTFNVNGPTYKVKGFEVQFVARITDGLTLEGSSSINSAEQSSTPCLPSNRPTAGNPTPIGQCISVVKENNYTNPYGVTGTRPPFSPPWMFNLRARYDWTMGDGFKPFAWIGASHIGPQSNEPASFPAGDDPTTCCVAGQPTTTLLRYDIPGYTTYDGAIGVSKDNWTVQLNGSNLSNEYGPSNISSGQFIKSEIPLRPRVVMAQFGWKF
ncbi:MAG TPA: TonB-dependent receptor [Steroidobacteraceae bacterium]|nr:TonB-dependent receptor [Steroidobacteraceae bacterium]